MNPEVIRLFDKEPSRRGASEAPGPATPDLSEDLDSFWNLTQNLVEARDRLEKPFQSVLQRSALLRTELRQANEKLRMANEKLRRADERVRSLEAELKRAQQADQGRQNQLIQAKAHLAATAQWHKQAEETVHRYQAYAQQLASYAESVRQTLVVTQRRNQDLSKTVTEYRDRWASLLERDQQMSKALAKLRSEFQLKLDEKDAQLESERKKAADAAEASLRKLAEAEGNLAGARKELETERAALAMTSKALRSYQAQWKSAFDANAELTERVNAMQSELSQGRELLSSFGPIEDRQLLLKQVADQKLEIERLRQQLVAKANAERELAEARRENDQLLAEFMRESMRFKELADQDHAAKAALQERVARLEQFIAAQNP